MKGSYILVIQLKNDSIIDIGRIGKIHFKIGYYVYIGSALNSLEKRIQRHLRNTKKIHWHIDYLLDKAKVIDVFYKESEGKEECNIANNFKKLYPIEGFGCSDCKCNSHLFFGKIDEILKIVKNLNMNNFNYSVR